MVLGVDEQNTKQNTQQKNLKMTSVQNAYDLWSQSYDKEINKTRDLEGMAVQQWLLPRLISISGSSSILELGCGTGKNTIQFLHSNSSDDLRIVACDLSAKMLACAQANQEIAPSVNTGRVQLRQLDLTDERWENINDAAFDLVTFSLVRISFLVSLFSSGQDQDPYQHNSY